MSVENFEFIVSFLFVFMFIVSTLIGICAAENNEDSTVCSILPPIWLVLVVGFIVVIFNDPYRELRKEIESLTPKLTKQQIANSGPTLKEIYKEIRLQEYKKKLEKDFNERK